MFRIVPLLCALVLMTASGISHRLWTGSWNVSGEPGISAARLSEVSSELGDWVGADLEVDAKQLARAEAVGYLCRRYVQRRTGAEVSVFLLCGRPGPIAVHPPTICYQGLGFQVMGSPTRYTVESDAETPPAEFYCANFVKPDSATPEQLRIYWAWKAGRDWQAPNHPRFTFGGAQALYKLYLTYRAAPGAELPDHDPCQDFMHDFLLELENKLSPAS
ncbi:MAG TPA: exosortase-associated EpsI family protein [Gemmataceae bacterium]|nr:exosortase-associated EpsI family protein [Gemmataceae bacterium]